MSEERAWIIQYADVDMKDEFFAGYGAEEAARKRFERACDSWTVRLFMEVDRSGYGPENKLPPVASIPPDPPPMASEDEANREAFGQDSACYRAFIKWLEENPFLTPTWTDAWRAASLSALSDRQMLVEALEETTRAAPICPRRRWTVATR